MTTTTTTIAERVAAGAAWLDEHQPGWVDRIDLDRLDLQNCDRCMLGQLYGEYNNALEMHFNDDERRATALGFEIDPYCYYDEAVRRYAALTAAWRELIEGRRAGAS